MATQQITTVKTENIGRAMADASLALGKAWGLAYVCCDITEGGTETFNVGGVLRSVRHQIGIAAEKVQGVESANLAVGEALAVCDLVTADAQETAYGTDSPSMWALEALPDALQRAKAAVDAVELSVQD
jgi:hypothetical protein